jgi:hypothetical protein
VAEQGAHKVSCRGLDASQFGCLAVAVVDHAAGGVDLWGSEFCRGVEEPTNEHGLSEDIGQVGIAVATL